MARQETWTKAAVESWSDAKLKAWRERRTNVRALQSLCGDDPPPAGRPPCCVGVRCTHWACSSGCPNRGLQTIESSRALLAHAR